MEKTIQKRLFFACGRIFRKHKAAIFRDPEFRSADALEFPVCDMLVHFIIPVACRTAEFSLS